jgi:short-subunit dehydrogenase
MYIITGCSSGLGYSITKQLLKKDLSVIGLSRSVGKCGSFIEFDNFKHFSVDLAEELDFTDLDYLLDGDEIRIIINAAHFQFEGDKFLNPERSKSIFNVNYFSAVALVEKFKDRGLKRVLFVNSVAGKVAQQGQAQYSASKHALQAYSETLSKYSVGKGFDVMTINPGGIDTELWSGEEILEKAVTDTFIQPTVLSDLICSLLMLPYKTYIQSAVILPEYDI